MSAKPCSFCSIVADHSQSLVFYEDDHTLAFMDRLPMTDGHCLVIPKRHVKDVWELTDDDAAQVFQTVRRVAHLVRERLRPHGVNLINNNGRAADQTQFHFHVHVVPRYGGDQLLPPSLRYSHGAHPFDIEPAYRLLLGDRAAAGGGN